MTETLTLTAPRYLTPNERSAIEEGLRRKARENEQDQSDRDQDNDNSRTIGRIQSFLRWTGLSVEAGIETHSDPSQAASTIPPRFDDSEMVEREVRSAPTGLISDSSNRVADNLQAGGSSVFSISNNARLGDDSSSAKPSKLQAGKRAWATIQACVRLAGLPQSDKDESKETDENRQKLDMWLPAPVDMMELIPRPWNIMRTIGGTIEYVSHEPHSLLLRPGSEALAEILVTQSRSEMLGALKRAQLPDHRELQYQNLAQQVNE